MGFIGKAGAGLASLMDFFGKLDGDTIALVSRFGMRAVKSGDPNAYVKAHLQRILDSEQAAEIAQRGVVSKAR
jgi:hypothetical protein